MEVETLPTFSAFSRNSCNFKQIYAVGDPENGYHFGQVTSPSGRFVKEGAVAEGLGDDSTSEVDSYYTLCECYVAKREGRWVITEEYVVTGQEAARQVTRGVRPFAKTILDVYGDTSKKAECKSLEELETEMQKVQK